MKKHNKSKVTACNLGQIGMKQDRTTEACSEHAARSDGEAESQDGLKCEKLLKIDIHTHILPPQIPKFKEKFGGGNFIHLRHHSCGGADMVDDQGKVFRRVENNCFDPRARLEDCRDCGVDVQVLSTVPVMFNYHAPARHGEYIAQRLNDHLASVVAEHPKKFIGLGTLPMQSPQLAIKELERCRRQLNFPGVQIGSHINEWNLSDPALTPFFAAAESLEAAIFVHPWDMMGREKMPRYWLPWLVGMPAETSLAICSVIFGGVLAKFPKLKIAFAHGGGSFPMTIGRIQHGHSVRPDLCAVDEPTPPREFLGRFWLDSLVHDKAVLDYIIQLVGAERVCLGSDYPFPLGELRPGELIESGDYPEDIKRQLLADSACEWLGVDKTQWT